jgi:hypothetical protein
MRRFVPSALILLLTAGLTRLPAQQAPPVAPVVPAKHVESGPAKARDISKLSAPQQTFYRSAYQGMEWLRRTNKQDGKFVYGFIPALRVPMDADSYIAQAGAAFALARAGRYFGDESVVAIARQALLTLLLETAVDPQDPTVRTTAAPPHLLNRLASHGALVLAIHELPTPGKDLLAQADQLCNDLKKRQRTDGALVAGFDGEDPRSDTIVASAGLALHAVIRSHTSQPAPWKPEMLRKARAYYQAEWTRHKSVPLAVTHTPAYAEAFLLTKDRDYADLVFALNDWLCSLQYEPRDPARARWVGGFPPWADGKPLPAAPDIGSAAVAESLAEACRVARATGDVARLRRYQQALERCLHFVVSLQYTEARTQHYVESFRPALLGAFHASDRDGDLRIDHTQHALSALVQYLAHAAE